MQNFQTAAGKAYSFDDDVKIVIAGGISKVYTATGEQITSAPADLTPCANNELPSPTAAELWVAYQGKARAALDATDMVAIRCWKAGVAFPADWQAYVTALRAIAGATSGDPTQPLPATPAYPVST